MTNNGALLTSWSKTHLEYRPHLAGAAAVEEGDEVQNTVPEAVEKRNTLEAARRKLEWQRRQREAKNRARYASSKHLACLRLLTGLC